MAHKYSNNIHLLSILPKTNKSNSNDIQNDNTIFNIINDIWVKNDFKSFS